MTDAVTPPEEPTNISYKLKRDVDGFIGKWQIWWQRKLPLGGLRCGCCIPVSVALGPYSPATFPMRRL
jgi:hypothetical protein